MSLSQSMKNVFKTKGQHLLSAFMKEDVKKIVKDVVADVVVLTKKRNSIREFSLKHSLQEFRANVQDTAVLLRVIPQRISNGLRIFMTEFIHEMETLPDQKERTVYSMKVLAALSKFAFFSAYELGFSGAPKLLVLGKSRGMYSNLIMSRLLYKSIQAFLVRFIEEVEKDVVDPEELKNLQSFKDIVLDDAGNAVDKFFEGMVDPDDKAFALVENFKNYIFTGELLDR
jgi:hypothetical protein